MCILDPPSIKDELVKRKEGVTEAPGDSEGIAVVDGIRGSPIFKGQSVVVIAEYVPSWLAIVDSWGAAQVSLYCEGELEGFRESLELETPVRVHRSLAGAKTGMWWKEEKRIVMVQGTSGFVSKILHALVSIGITKQDQVIVAANKKIRKSPISLHFKRIFHGNIGGVTSTTSFIGFSENFPLAHQHPSSVTTSHLIQRRLQGLLNVTTHASEHPKSLQQKVCEATKLVTLDDLIESSFLVTCLFNASGTGYRALSIKEILTAMDFPKSVVDSSPTWLSLQDKSKVMKLVDMVPLKVLQGASAMLEIRRELPQEAVDTLVPTKMSLAATVPNMELIYEGISQAKAAKNDDALADVQVWNEAVMKPPSTWTSSWSFVGGKAMTRDVELMLSELRFAQSNRFKRNVETSFVKYITKKHGAEIFEVDSMNPKEMNQDLLHDLSAGYEAIDKANLSSFWDWEGGSAPFFWRWQSEVQKDLRDGTPLWVSGRLPRYKRSRQMLPREPEKADQVKRKLSKVINRGYISPEEMVNVTSYFDVPKGDDDIRMVYDFTASKLNDALWAPNFWLPTISNVLDCTTHSSWFGDVDAGEMFLNFPLDREMRKYCGVDVSCVYPSSSQHKKRTVHCWQRMAMGMKPSPWVTTRLLSWLTEIVKGDRTEPSNPFKWDKVVLNLPGMEDYDPSMPRVYKWNNSTKSIACDVKTFVDDYRTCGPTFADVQRATHKLETTMSYLGVQDAVRKRRPCTQTPGEWTGAISLAIEDVGLFVTVSEKKWAKAKNILQMLLDEVVKAEDDLPMLNFKSLESHVGFLVHLSMAYPDMTPFLRGFYLTMNSWRDGRDELGWKLSNTAFNLFMSQCRRNADDGRDPLSSQPSNQDAPTRVQAVPLFKEHLLVLVDMFKSIKPVLRLVRGKNGTIQVGYVFGDASGEGFGASWTRAVLEEIGYRFGIWGAFGEDTSSNLREFHNLVDSVERMGEAGDLRGKEVFVFTDNSTAEAIAHKGSSSSPILFDLVVRLYKLSMKYECSLQFVHVAGTRMIHQGTDGLSRGDMLEGVMKGDSMLSHVPLHVGAIERQPNLRRWLKDVFTSSDGAFNDNSNRPMEFLTPEDWFERGHDIKGYSTNLDGVTIPSYDKGLMVWSPPPAAARFAIEELRQARHKRQDSTHIFLVPRLMTREWRRQILKAADLFFEIPAGHCEWPADMFEPLTIAIFFPYLDSKPWQLKGTPFMGGVERSLYQVCSGSEGSVGNILSELWSVARGMDAMSVPDLCRLLRRRRGLKISNQ